MPLFMGQHLVVFYSYPRPVLIKAAFDIVFKAFIVVTKFNIDIAAGEGGVGGMRVGIACKIAPGKLSRSAPGNQVVRLYYGNAQE
jgi:hypothetical protein